MKINEEVIRKSPLPKTIIRTALLVGGLSFAAGFIGPILVSPSSNLGPLLGIFVTGPIGTLAGALWGVVRSSKHANASEMRAIFKTLLAIWIVTLLYTLFMISLSIRSAFPVICLQGLIVVASIIFLYYGDSESRLPKPIKKSRLIIIVALVIVMFVTLFPPVTKPKLAKKSEQENIDSTLPLPKVAFILDKRFDASHHIPMFAVNRRFLILEWVILIIVAISLSLTGIRLSGQNDLEFNHNDSP